MLSEAQAFFHAFGSNKVLSRHVGPTSTTLVFPPEVRLLYYRKNECTHRPDKLFYEHKHLTFKVNIVRLAFPKDKEDLDLLVFCQASVMYKEAPVDKNLL